MIDWTQPIEALNLKNGSIISACIDSSFTRKHAGVPVKLTLNIWTGTLPAGTWYINNDGYVICGLSPQGYEGRYIIRNKRTVL